MFPKICWKRGESRRTSDQLCQDFCVNDLVLFLGMGCRGRGQFPFPGPALLGTVDTKLSGVASGVLNASRQAGSVVGVALLGSLIERQHPFIPGIRGALMISVGVVLAGCLSAFLIRPEKHGTKERKGIRFDYGLIGLTHLVLRSRHHAQIARQTGHKGCLLH
jgi:hypothetical protein